MSTSNSDSNFSKNGSIEQCLVSGIEMKATKENKLPFDVTIYETTNKEVINPFSGKSAILTPIQVAVYESIMGSHYILQLETDNTSKDIAKDMIQKGRAWFYKYPEIYRILLD